RRRRRRRRPHAADGARHRRLRQHPRARRVLRARRAQAHARPQHAGAVSRRGPRRAVGRARGDAERARLRRAARRDGGHGAGRSLRGAAARPPALPGTRRRRRALTDRFHERWDILLTPGLATLPPKLGWIDMMLDDVDEYWRRVFHFSPFTVWFNITGQPAMMLPLGVASDGLPVAVQVVARYGDEATLF